MTLNEDNPFYGRSFFPIFDSTGKFVVGWSGRSIFEQCPNTNCQLYHNPQIECPNEQKYLYGKWRHSQGLEVRKYLYNYNFAIPFIDKFKSAIICEGPGDVWAYEMAGIKNAVSIFGLTLSDEHRKLLLKAGARTIYINLDNDKAGQDAAENIKEKLEDYFRTYIITTKGKDAGSMKPHEITTDIWPFIKEVAYVEKDK
jgi:5S rRNA maturation endonuclease (ribonuclease M5)